MKNVKIIYPSIDGDVIEVVTLGNAIAHQINKAVNKGHIYENIQSVMFDILADHCVELTEDPVGITVNGVKEEFKTKNTLKDFLKFKDGKELDIKFPIILLDKNNNNNKVYFENSKGYWYKSEFDKNNNQIYLEDQDGVSIDKRTKEISIKEIEQLLGYKIKVVK